VSDRPVAPTDTCERVNFRRRDALWHMAICKVNAEALSWWFLSYGEFSQKYT